MGRVVLMIAALVFAAPSALGQETSRATMEKPNIVIIFTDDQGFGDIGVFGHPMIRTPRLDRMANEGQKWTNFYVGAAVCTPSRAALMTGRLPMRNGMMGRRRVLFPDSANGLPQEETTLAELLLDAGYRTHMVGKWHLGHLDEHLPMQHGFESYFGIPYSNDMNWKTRYQDVMYDPPNPENYDVPLVRGNEEVERPAQQFDLTKRYTEAAVEVIEENADEPFFLYLAHSLPHIPLFVSEEFEGRSDAGFYGDVIEEIDWSVGKILDTLERVGVAENTLVFFTSDNGPWLTMDDHGGSAGMLRNGKGTTWEGGMRVPAIVYWPGTIEPAVIHQLGATLDILPTAADLAGVPAPSTTLDGESLVPVLLGEGASPREAVFYWRERELHAVRKGDYKAHFITKDAYKRDDNRRTHEQPLLFNVASDPAERFDVADRFPDIVAELERLAATHRRSLSGAPSSLLEAKIEGSESEVMEKIE